MGTGLENVHNTTLDDINRVIKDYLKPDDKFAIAIINKGGKDNIDGVRKLVKERLSAKAGTEYTDSLINFFYDGNLMKVVDILVKDKFDDIAKLQRKIKAGKIPKLKVKTKTGLIYYRSKPRRYNQQELLFITQRLKKKKSFKDIVESYNHFFGDVRSEIALRNKYYRVGLQRSKRLNLMRLKRAKKR